jgi:hypothetical protein
MDRHRFTADNSQFSKLSEAIAEVVIPVDRACLIEARALLDALAARVARAEAEFAAAGLPELDGTGSMAAWLRHHVGLTEPESRRSGLRAERLASWRGFADAWEHGVLTGAQVDLAVALIPAHHVDRFSNTDADTARALRQLTPQQTRIVLRHWVQRADAAAEVEAAMLAAESGAGEAEPAPPDRSLFCSRTLDDIAIIDGRLHADGAAVVEAALRVAERPDEPEESRSAASRRADALISICGFYLDNHAGVDELGRQRPHLTVVVDLPQLFASTLRSAGVRSDADLERFLRTHRVAPGDRVQFVEAFERLYFGSAFSGSAFSGSAFSGAPHAYVGADTDTSGSASPGVPLAMGVPLAIGSTSGTPSLEGARTLDGRPISALAVSVLTCDSILERLLVADQRVIDHGRSVREFSSSQRRAVFARDQGCRFPGCSLGPRHCQVHHLEPWQTGGRTDLSNAVALCSFHHHVVHRPKWRASLGSRGEFIVHRADGSTLQSRDNQESTTLLAVATIPPSRPVSAVRSCSGASPEGTDDEFGWGLEFGSDVEFGSGGEFGSDVEELVRLARQRARDLRFAA